MRNSKAIYQIGVIVSLRARYTCGSVLILYNPGSDAGFRTLCVIFLQNLHAQLKNYLSDLGFVCAQALDMCVL